jgi:hypothetical protein
MADSASMTTPNLQEFLNEIQNFPAAIRKRLLVGAVATGARLVRDDAKALAPLWTGPVSEGHPPPGTLKNAIYMARLVHKCTPTSEVWAVDVKTGTRTIKRGKNKGEVTNDKDAYYAVWVELGHYTRTPQGPGSRKSRQAAAIAGGLVRFVPGKPYMRPAFERNKVAALNAMGDYIAKNLPAACAAFKYIKAIS